MRKLVTIQEIAEKKTIEDADKIEAVRINGWWVVALKDQFKVGDKCAYFEIDSFLPVKPEFEFLLKGSKPKKMLSEGKEVEGIRLKTVRLRKQISQGLVTEIPKELKDSKIGEDVTEYFGVIKYEQPISVDLRGKAKGSFPSFIPKTDEERIQNMKGILSQYVVTEKLDGTSATFYKKEGIFGVCSRNLELEKVDNYYWKMAEKYKLEENMPDDFCLQGEIIGEGIQQNPLKQTGQDVYFFNAYNIRTGAYLDQKSFANICEELDLKTVPVVDDNFALLPDIDKMLEYSEGKSALNKDCEREGVVIRSKVKINGERVSFKVISNKYLLK